MNEQEFSIERDSRQSTIKRVRQQREREREREKYSLSLLLLEREDIRLRVATLVVAGGT